MKAIVSIVGKDQVGIIANVCSELAACNINILEISQKIMDGFFYHDAGDRPVRL